MAYHRDHVKRFLEQVDLTSAEKKAIEDRAEAVIVAFSNKKDGLFSGGKLLKVLGKPEHERKFNHLWEKGKLHP